MNYDLLLDFALEKAKEMPENQEFELKDLFEHDQWENLGSYRGSLGTKFRKRIEQNDLGIEQVQKAARKSNKYINKNKRLTIKSQERK